MYLGIFLRIPGIQTISIVGQTILRFNSNLEQRNLKPITNRVNRTLNREKKERKEEMNSL